jgi:hypothetical protein
MMEDAHVKLIPGLPWQTIIWTDHVRNEEVLLSVNKQRNILHEIRKQKANCIIEGKIKGLMVVTRRRGRRRTKLLD